MSTASQKENSGLRVNYYLAQVDHPQREEQPPYQAECEDLIDALGLTPDEANIFKEIWRTANERTHGKGKEGNNPLRAAQKLVHYAGRILKKALRTTQPVDTDEWFPWSGESSTGPCDSTARIEIECHSGGRTIDLARTFSWKWIDEGSDIVRWRYAP